jgi:hypothetical protein
VYGFWLKSAQSDPTPLLSQEELEKERHGDEENIDGWLKIALSVSICI